MKVCKKCKKKVANKTKICKYCGADVSKAKIIISANNKIKTNNSRNQSKNKFDNLRIVSKTDVIVNEDNVKQKEIIKKNVKNVCAIEKVKDAKLELTKIVNLKTRFRSILEDIRSAVNNSIYQIKLIVIKGYKSISESGIFKEKIKIKLGMIVLVCLIICGLGFYYGRDVFRSFTNADNTVVVGEKATTEKIFGMEDLITYNGVDYKIIKIETSKGNNYKEPKEGNQFLIVTIYMKNNSGQKVHYNYKNWTMSNSLGQEESRIFTSINVENALYSGDLVIGGIKTGSLVFEQPINDSKLRMNFYELKTKETGEEIADKSKKIFSVSVKVPEKTEDGVSKNSITTKDNNKGAVVKTSKVKKS